MRPCALAGLLAIPACGLGEMTPDYHGAARILPRGADTPQARARGGCASLLGSLLTEDLDGIALGEGNDGLLPGAGHAGDIADALLLGLHRNGVDLEHVDAEELSTAAAISSLGAFLATSKVYLFWLIRSNCARRRSGE